MAAGIVGAVALASRVAYGPGFASYDPLWSLIWGRQLTHGELPDFEALPIAPTPHPLANAAGAVATLWGQQGPAVMELLGFLGFGLLGWAAFRLGRELFGTVVGVAFALVLLTAPPLVDEALQAVVDVPFLALVLWAAALEARERDRAAPLVLLGLAGLLRPEAWLLSAALVAYRATGASPAQVGRWALIAAVAPVAWALSDLVVTGDPLHALHTTRSFGSLLDVPTGTGTALGQAPRFLRFFLADAVVWAGLVGLVAALWLLYRRAVLPAAVLGLGLLGLATLGIVDLPLTYRYAVVPAAMIALFAAVAVFGWSSLPAGAARSWWRVLGLGGGLLVVALAAPGIASDLRLVGDRAERMRADQAALRAVLERGHVAVVLRRCRPVMVPDFLLVPSVAYRAELNPADVTLQPRGRRSAVLRATAPPPRFARGPVARNGRWAVYSGC